MNDLDFEALRSLDTMLTEIWLNGLLVNSQYFPKMFVDMNQHGDHAKWVEFREKLRPNNGH